MRLWIAVFLLTIFSAQALPVLAVGKAFVKAQMSVTEEDADDGGNGGVPSNVKIKKQSPLMEDFLHNAAEASIYYTAGSDRILRLHDAAHLPVLFAGEVTTPPPDRC